MSTVILQSVVVLQLYLFNLLVCTLNLVASLHFLVPVTFMNSRGLRKTLFS
jgi:hypothetical protein